MIAYDLSDPVVANNLIFHPATGEILHCRINIGHGLWKEERERYYLLNGLDDNGSFIDFDSQKMAGELLCSVWVIGRDIRNHFLKSGCQC